MSSANQVNLGANMFQKGLQGATNYLNKFGKNNDSVKGLIHGGLIDATLTQMKGGLSLSYNQAMSSHLAQLNQGLEAAKTGNQMTLMGTEGRIAGELIGKQGEQERLTLKDAGDQQRQGFVTQGEQDRLTLADQGDQDRQTLGKKGEQDRLTLETKGDQDRQLVQAQGSQDRQLAQTKGAEDRSTLAAQGTQDRLNIAAKGTEERAAIVAKGGQDRETLSRRYQEDRNMRADARGAIRSLGARFFG